MNQPAQSPLVLIITGLSGAGHSVAIKALEDIGFYCIDNLPMQMVESAIAFIRSNVEKGRNFALGMDIRTKDFAKSFAEFKKQLSTQLQAEVVFVTADEAVIADRYTANRRKHPLLDSGGELVAAIRRERALLRPVEAVADVVLDTSTLSPHALTRQLQDRYGTVGSVRQLFVTVQSFGFKYGVPRVLDALVDVRFLPNPHFVPDLKKSTGVSNQIQDYVFREPTAQSFMDKLVDMYRLLLPLYYQEGKHYLRIAIGCTGGKHRSVAVAERLARALSEQDNANILVSVAHRDIDQLD